MSDNGAAWGGSFLDPPLLCLVQRALTSANHSSTSHRPHTAHSHNRHPPHARATTHHPATSTTSNTRIHLAHSCRSGLVITLRTSKPRAHEAHSRRHGAPPWIIDQAALSQFVGLLGVALAPAVAVSARDEARARAAQLTLVDRRAVSSWDRYSRWSREAILTRAAHTHRGAAKTSSIRFRRSRRRASRLPRPSASHSGTGRGQRRP